MNQFKDRRLRALLLCYGVVLLYLLYLQRLPGQAFAGRVNLVPGQTLRTYGRAAWFGLQTHRPALLRYAAGNLAGNLALFFPAGLLLPARFPGLQRFWRFFGVLAGAVALVEALQALPSGGDFSAKREHDWKSLPHCGKINATRRALRAWNKRPVRRRYHAHCRSKNRNPHGEPK